MSAPVISKTAGTFDNERFISEVRSRPAIWDTNAIEYLDSELKKKCWLEILHIFFTKSTATDAEVLNFSKFLQQRWEIMRNEFLSEYHQRLSYTKSGFVLNDQPPYKYPYYKQLSFLQPVLPVNANCPNTLPQQHDDVKEIIDVLRTGFKQRTDIELAKENDGDRLFLLSLLDSVKKVPESFNLSVRMQMMQVIDNVCRLDACGQGFNLPMGIAQRQYPENPNVLMQPKKKRKVDQVTANAKEVANELRMSFKRQMDVEIARENDGDRQFLLSMLNSMKRVPESLKLSVKMQILQVIDNACRVDVPAAPGYNRTQPADNAHRVDDSATPGCSRTSRKLQRQYVENQRSDHQENQDQHYSNASTSQRPAGSPGTTASRHSSYSSYDSDNP